MQAPSQILSDNGPIAKHVSGFTARLQQQEMADAVLKTILNQQMLIAEAGTGTGKTFAYLVPALLSGKKVIISTGTKTLQDQLFRKDLPIVRKALGVPVTTALLKGRSNYLCIYRLENAANQQALFPEELDELENVRQWAGRTRSGDVTELYGLDEDSSIWRIITSTTDNCLGTDCPDYQNCHLVKARREAQEADILVINHHLLFSDMALREEGFGEVLPGANAFVMDEAHLIPEIASVFFGNTLSSRQLIELSRDVLAEYKKSASDMTDLEDAASRLENAARKMRKSFGTEIKRETWQDSINKKLQKNITEVDKALDELKTVLDIASERSKELDACASRAQVLHERFCRITNYAESDYVRWYETFKTSFSLYMTPLNIANIFHSQIERYRAAWIFTSATLAIGSSFDYYIKQLGLEEAHAAQWQSPFDYQRQSLMYLPQGLPDPTQEGYTDAVVEAAIPVIEYSGGRTFFLFTSYRALRRAETLLKDEIDYPLLVQGRASRGELLDSFRRLGNAVLLGTSSFWEGVDVRGEALSCVIIDKLPFAPPDDPVLQARIDVLRKQGGNPFMEYQVPNAAIMLKQGAGRLIRDINDTGVMMLCDPRLLTKSYGKVFIKSLPPMPQTRRLVDVEAFFEKIPATREREAV